MLLLLTNRQYAGGKLHDEEIDPGEIRLFEVELKHTKYEHYTYEWEEEELEYKTKVKPILVPHEDRDHGYASILAKLSNEDKAKPWVFFVHGNNQSADKNIVKCIKLHDTHKVNVIAFSWPSKPALDFTNRALVAALKAFFKNPSPTTIAKKIIKEFIDAKSDAYQQARQNAKDSVTQLKTAFEESFEKLFNHISGCKKSLLVHSLGHLLYREFSSAHGPFIRQLEFSNAIFHQGDEEYAEKDTWINDGDMSYVSQKIFVTHNRRDGILLLSEFEKFYSNTVQNNTPRRLGRGNGPFSVATGNKIHHIEFTGVDVDSPFCHNYFVVSEETNSDVYTVMNGLLTSQDVGNSFDGFDEPGTRYYKGIVEKPEPEDFFEESEDF